MKMDFRDKSPMDQSGVVYTGLSVLWVAYSNQFQLFHDSGR
jgi:hypothetical protein